MLYILIYITLNFSQKILPSVFFTDYIDYMLSFPFGNAKAFLKNAKAFTDNRLHIIQPTIKRSPTIKNTLQKTITNSK